MIDGCIRDSGKAMELDLGYWVRGTTPNFHIQTNVFPSNVNVPAPPRAAWPVLRWWIAGPAVGMFIGKMP